MLAAELSDRSASRRQQVSAGIGMSIQGYIVFLSARVVLPSSAISPFSPVCLPSSYPRSQPFSSLPSTKQSITSRLTRILGPKHISTSRHCASCSSRCSSWMERGPSGFSASAAAVRDRHIRAIGMGTGNESRWSRRLIHTKE